MPNNQKDAQWLDILIAKAIRESLAFGLSDNLGGNVIHLDSSIPRHLNLSITNNLKVEVEIAGGPGPASSKDYHFHLQFVNNTCRFETLAQPSNWHMKTKIDDDGYVTDIYLLSNDKIILSPAAPAEQTTTVQLRYTGAKLSQTEIPILQVAVTVGQNVYVMVQPPEPVTETVTKHLATFMAAGPPSPLMATLVQPKTILNEGTTRDLLLRLVNMSPEPVAFTPPTELGKKTPTAIQLSVDIDDHDAAAWALCKSDEASSIVVCPPTDWNKEPATNGTGQMTWLFRPDYTRIKQIPANSAVEFHIKGVRTTLPPGFTNLYVTLHQFLNYGTQTVVTQIEKSPLIYNEALNSGLLSQGTTGANQALTLNGNTTGDLMLVEQSGEGSSAHFKGGAGVNIDNLVLSGDARLSDHTLWLRSTPDKDDGLGWYGNNKTFANTNVGGPVTFGLEGGALGSTDGGERIALSWKQTGNVGIGTSEPKSALSVKGGVAVGSSYADTQAVPANTLIVQGSAGIGIGPNELQSQFQVRSSNGIRLGLEGNGGGQLVLGNSPNDKSVQLVAIDPSEKNKAADFMYLGGPFGAPQLPLLQLNAKQVNVETSAGGSINIDAGSVVCQAPETVVSGTINIDSLIIRGELDVYGRGLYVTGPVHVGGTDKAAIYLRNPQGAYSKLSFDQLGNRDDWAIWTTSDSRLKKEQRPIQDALNKVLRLRGMTFGWNEEGVQKFTRSIDEQVSAGPKASEEQHESARNQERQRVRKELAGNYLGLLAQDVEKVVPEAVNHDEEGHKQICYHELVPLLVEAIKEQAAQIEALTRQVSALTENS